VIARLSTVVRGDVLLYIRDNLNHTHSERLWWTCLVYS